MIECLAKATAHRRTRLAAMTSAALSKLTGLASTSKSSTQDGYVALKAVIERSEADVEDLIAFLDAKCAARIAARRALLTSSTRIY